MRLLLEWVLIEAQGLVVGEDLHGGQNPGVQVLLAEWDIVGGLSTAQYNLLEALDTNINYILTG